jgi:hypothetical protein
MIVEEWNSRGQAEWASLLYFAGSKESRFLRHSRGGDPQFHPSSAYENVTDDHSIEHGRNKNVAGCDLAWLPVVCRVSLTYRVKSAHKVKLTDKQLLQWMFPILLVMLIYLGTWTLSAPPTAEQIRDQAGLRFKQCSYNWWDHSLAIGEHSILGYIILTVSLILMCGHQLFP